MGVGVNENFMKVKIKLYKVGNYKYLESEFI